MATDRRVPNIAGKTVTPLKDGIIVQHMQFKERKSPNGIIILDDDGIDRGIRPRWGQVSSIGPDQKDVKVGEWLLIAHGRWSRGFMIDNVMSRTVDPDDILVVSDKEMLDNQYVLSKENT